MLYLIEIPDDSFSQLASCISAPDESLSTQLDLASDVGSYARKWSNVSTLYICKRVIKVKICLHYRFRQPCRKFKMES